MQHQDPATNAMTDRSAEDWSIDEALSGIIDRAVDLLDDPACPPYVTQMVRTLTRILERVPEQRGSSARPGTAR
jgi:hypothetical protein